MSMNALLERTTVTVMLRARTVLDLSPAHANRDLLAVEPFAQVWSSLGLSSPHVISHLVD